MDRTSVRIGLGIFALVAVLVAADVAHDASLGAEAEHLIIEGVLMLAAGSGAALFFRWLRRLRDEAKAEARVERSQARHWQQQAERWRSESQDLMQGLSQAIDRQLEEWKLTPAEKEVALLLLKGLSHKEIAGVREASDRTVRKQAASLYAKAGLGGRAELSAFFLEDLLVPV
jgi:DNA-binding NarL/FixJ family response regulator